MSPAASNPHGQQPFPWTQALRCSACQGQAVGNFLTASARRFVDTVQGNIRRGDIFARIGGDEFCLLLRRCPRETGQRKIERMQEAFRRSAPGDYPCGFSCGILEIPEGHAPTDADDLLHEADGRMYSQKEDHRRDYMPELYQE